MLEKNFGSQTFGLVLARAFAQIADCRGAARRDTDEHQGREHLGDRLRGRDRHQSRDLSSPQARRLRRSLQRPPRRDERRGSRHEERAVSAGSTTSSSPRNGTRQRTSSTRSPTRTAWSSGSTSPARFKGGMEAGPNAVLGAAREGYKKTAINLRLDFGHL